MKTLGYYPGCSLRGGGIELDLSVRALARAAGVELREIEDWNCCGASAAHSLDHALAVALPYRVLALAESQGLSEVLAPCAACFSRLKGTGVRLSRSPELSRRMHELVERPYRGSVSILNINEFVAALLAGGLSEKLTRKLGLKAVAYYGCLLSRGQDIVTNDDAEDPKGMEAAIRAAGCEVLPWNSSNECCGGGFSMSKTGSVLDLSQAVLDEARAAGADLVVTGCPMCHSNLDMRQLELLKRRRIPGAMPILYLSELLGLAAGLEPAALGLDRHFIGSRGLVRGGA
ncbi:MAG: CoB--CoM heterodisulfide reductase iron-sulfur subunit B family protein [Elusimicrobiota bacterium]|jgi:heterodisulfide reductase subunit B